MGESGSGKSDDRHGLSAWCARPPGSIAGVVLLKGRDLRSRAPSAVRRWLERARLNPAGRDELAQPRLRVHRQFAEVILGPTSAAGAPRSAGDTAELLSLSGCRAG